MKKATVILLTGAFGICALAQTTFFWQPAPTIKSSTSTNFNITTGPVLTQTNFISGQLYTNNSSGLISVHATATLTAALVAGVSELDLQTGNPGVAMTTVDSAKMLTGVSALAGTPQLSLNATITNGGVYTFTNNSIGAGNSASVMSGTGQLTTY